MISIGSRDGFSGFTFAAFSVKNIPVVVAVMIFPSLIKSLNFPLQIKTTYFFTELYDSHMLFVLFSSHKTIYATGKNILTETVTVSKPLIDSSTSFFLSKLLIYVSGFFTIVCSLRIYLFVV